MNTEINNLINFLNEIQMSVYNGSPITKEMNTKWANAVKRIHELGFKPRKKEMCCEVDGRIVGRVLWVASKKRPRTSQKYCAGNWVKDEHEKNHNTECTTRALYFCLNHEIPYQQIRSMQNVKALRKFGRGRCFGWNTETVWGEILGENGFVKLCLSRSFYSGVLATKLANIDTKVIIHSSHHLSACYKGSVVDDWDSRRKLADAIYVKIEMVEAVRCALGM
jgi:hypothetical protein